MITRVPPPLTCHSSQIIIYYHGPVISTCILNQSRDHWLLTNALNFVISISSNFKNEITISFDSIMDEDASHIVLEITCLAFNIKKEVIRFLDYFIFFLRKYEEKTHNMFSLILDPRFKSFHSIKLFIK
jgi:hypothetical protein